MSVSREKVKLAIDWAIGGFIATIFVMDSLLAPPGLSMPFIYLTVLPFTLKAGRLRREAYRLGVVCSVLTVTAAVLKGPSLELVPLVIVNRFFALMAIGSVTYMVDSTIASEERDNRMAERIERLEQRDLERRMGG